MYTIIRFFRAGIFSVLIALFLAACSTDTTTTGQGDPSNKKLDQAILTKALPVTEYAAKIPELSFYLSRLKKSLEKDPPVMSLSLKELGDESAFKAQQLALRDKDFTRWTYDTAQHIPLRNEIMSVRPALPGDLTRELVDRCREESCYRVEMYNFYYNRASIAIVQPKEGKVLRVDHPEGARPTIGELLHKIALSIALESKEVTLALGINPTRKDVVMSNVQTALNHTVCERCKHLCVAPTFVKGHRALWTIVDLTNFRLIGMKWTEVGENSKHVQPVTERTLQDEVVMKRYCSKDNDTTLGKWSLHYRLTSSDGLEINQVKYDDRSVLASSKILDWHVSYSKKEGFGYNDAMGCPLFSTAAVVAFGGPEISKMKEGKAYVMVQDFRSPVWPKPCNYRYQNRYEFYPDGSFRIMGVQLGRGCGVPGTYRPVFRIQLSQSPEHPYHFEQWNGMKWQRWTQEGWHQQDEKTIYSPEGYLFRMINEEGKGYYIAPDQGQWQSGTRGDHAFTYVTVYHPDKDEGESNMTSFGSCCNTDYRQGPEVYLQTPEALDNQQLVIWYVPVINNDNTPGKEYCWARTTIREGKAVNEVWPCPCGPRFIPIR